MMLHSCEWTHHPKQLTVAPRHPLIQMTPVSVTSRGCWHRERQAQTLVGHPRLKSQPSPPRLTFPINKMEKMGKTCEPKAFSFQCMTKFTTKKKKKKKT